MQWKTKKMWYVYYLLCFHCLGTFPSKTILEAKKDL